MGKLSTIKNAAKKVIKSPRTKKRAEALAIGTMGGVVGNAIGGQYPTNPRKRKKK